MEEQASLLQALKSILHHRKTNEYFAEKLGFSLEEIKWAREELKKQGFVACRMTKDTLADIQEQEPETQLEEGGITEVISDREKGTDKVTFYHTSEALTDEQVYREAKKDPKKWYIAQLWHLKKARGFLHSVLFKPLQAEGLDNQAARELIQEVFTRSNLTPYKIQYSASNKKALFVYTADKHVAAQTKGNSPYSNEYNPDVFHKRMMLTLVEIDYLVQEFGRFEDIFIMDLGDAMDGMDGMTTRKGHKLPQNLSNKEAFRTYLSTHKLFFDNLLLNDVANHYHFIVQSEDNHGGDMAYMANEAVITYLNVRYPDVITTITDQFIDHFEYGDHTIIYTHGKDSEDLKHGLPLSLNEKTENFINKYIDYNSITTPYIHFVKADLHQNASQEAYKFRYRNVLSMYGMSKWIANNFGPMKAGCSFDIIEKHTERVFEHKIKF